MAVIQNITLDVNRPNIFYYINTKAGDNARRLKIRITVNGIVYKIPSGSSVKFRAIKPDDTFAYYDGTVNSDGACTVTLARSLLGVAGKIFADVAIIYGGTTVSSVSFVIMNRVIPGNVDTLASTSQYSQLNSFLNDASSYDSILLNKAIGIGLTASLTDDILTITKNS